MRLALDSSAYTDLCRGDRRTVDLVEFAVEVFLPFVVLAELRAGFRLGRHGVENEWILLRFLRRPGVQALMPDEETTHRYAAVYLQLRQQGPMPTNDMWIAAMTLQHDLALLPRDRRLDQLPQLRRA